MSTTNTAAANQAADVITEPHAPTRRRTIKSYYPRSFFIPTVVLYVVFFAIPSVASFYFSLTRWSLFDSQFIGFGNYTRMFADPQFWGSLKVTLVYIVVLVPVLLPSTVLSNSEVSTTGFAAEGARPLPPAITVARDARPGAGSA